MSKPYIVALTFNQPDRSALVATAVLAPTPEFAASMVVEEVVREGVEGQISGVSVMPLTRQFLENALRALDDKLPKSGKADIVSLVPETGQRTIHNPITQYRSEQDESA